MTARDRTVSAFQRDAYRPARQEITAVDLPVTGIVPADLNGRYLRNGPNPLQAEHPRFHYLLGAGMVHGVRLREGRAEWYRNRWVRQAAVQQRLGEPPRKHLVLGGIDSASNTNVVAHGGRILSLVEGGTLPYELDPELGTVGPHDFFGELGSGFTAHPKVDPLTGHMHSVGYYSGSPFVDHYVVDRTGRVVEHRTVDLPTRPMMHDFALTQNHLVLYDLPVVFHPVAALRGSRFPFRWDARKQARLGVLPRLGDSVRWFDIDSVWIYHTVNAYESDGAVVLDVITHPRMFTGAESSLEGHGTPSMDRYRIDLEGSGRVVRERLDDAPQEFPRVNESLVGQRHRFAYTATGVDLAAAWAPVVELEELGDDELGSALLKHDLRAGSVQRRSFATDAAVGEAVYVPREPGVSRTADTTATDEDDGYLLVFAHDVDRGASDLVILSAADFTGSEIARVHLPRRVPLGFHGSWVPDSELTGLDAGGPLG